MALSSIRLTRRPISQHTEMDHPNTYELEESYMLPASLWHRKRYQTTYKADYSHQLPQICGNLTNSSVLTRYTPEEWLISNQRHFNLADNTRAEAESMRSDAIRLIQDTEQKTQEGQKEAGECLGERIANIKYWQEELNTETDRLITETSRLQELKKHVTQSLEHTQQPLSIAKECLILRENRQGIDLVHDAVQEALIDECKIIQKCQKELMEALKNIDHQLDAMRKARWQLEKDQNNKFSALCIDEISHRLNNQSRSIYFYQGIEKNDNLVTVPETWADFTQRNIQHSQRERRASGQLRTKNYNLVSQCMNTLQNAWERTNAALTYRCTETSEAKNRLQNHLSKATELYDVGKHIDMLKRSIHDKMAPLKLAQTRLETRTHRPEIELCKDPAHNRLVQEVKDLEKSIESLREKLADAQVTQQSLLKTKSKLEGDIKVKCNSTFIDREKCLGIRRSFPIHNVSFTVS
ncbi:unnamed protein product [Darwinula stevensoni]|uniref:Tektin n=1 Tax=Darwinula stevensoni TaxID=69355 RepID=A0A7R8XCL9_9CRUS|nr:unnamed protein product [Darwinula stevensoni]CAG0893875.1 unnamed protein product [Darwinula stevensoni]